MVAAALVATAAAAVGLIVFSDRGRSRPDRLGAVPPASTAQAAPAALLVTARTSSTNRPSSSVASPPVQPWGYCGNIRGLADAHQLVTSGIATALTDARVTSGRITSYRVLAGTVTDLRNLENVTLPSGHYVLLLGGGPGSGPYYAAFGFYGVYRVEGTHAYQLCAYGLHSPRGGVTDTARIIALLRRALG